RPACVIWGSSCAVAREPSRSSELAEYRDHLAGDAPADHLERRHGRVLRDEHHPRTVVAEALDRGLVLARTRQQRGNDVAIVGGLLRADYHEVAVQDPGFDHRVTGHA